jgi:hypothetical protein
MDKRLAMACPVMLVLPCAAYLHMCEKLWQRLTTNDHRTHQLHHIPNDVNLAWTFWLHVQSVLVPNPRPPTTNACQCLT